METRNTSIYLEPSQIRYLKLLSMIGNMSMSELIREMLDRDMQANKEICKQHEKILF
jgi:predicted CopG family antitoxin